MIEIFIGVATQGHRAEFGIFMRDTVAQQSVSHYDTLEKCSENRAHVFAAQIAMTHIPEGSVVRLVTASQYLKENIARLTKWEAEGRLGDNGVANADLWRLLKFHRDRLSLHLVLVEPSILPDLDAEYVALLTEQCREKLEVLV